MTTLVNQHHQATLAEMQRIAVQCSYDWDREIWLSVISEFRTFRPGSIDDIACWLLDRLPGYKWS